MSPINYMCRQDSDVSLSLSHSLKDMLHYVKNDRHFCKNDLQNGGYIGMMYSAILFLDFTPHKTYIYGVSQENSQPVSTKGGKILTMMDLLKCTQIT